MAACAQDELLPPGKTDWKVSVLVGLFSFFFFSPRLAYLLLRVLLKVTALRGWGMLF